MAISTRNEKTSTITGYIIADLIFWRTSRSFSRKVARRSKIWSKIPATSAARIIFTNRWENTSGCFSIASLSAMPALTSLRMASMAFLSAWSFVCVCRMSRQRRMGMPASIIVANWRVNSTSACSFGFLGLPNPLNSCVLARWGATRTTCSPCSCSFASTSCSLSASIAPLRVRPLLSTASYPYSGIAYPP
jgi:hypothetical protein